LFSFSLSVFLTQQRLKFDQVPEKKRSKAEIYGGRQDKTK
jgi:hypothetical protein